MTNIILIVIDDLRKDYAYDQELMPSLNKNSHRKLAKSFTNCTATWGAMPTLLTGFMPFSITSKAGINTDIRHAYLPKIAKEQGYSTYGISASSVISHYYGYDYMFDYFQDFLPKEYKDSFWRSLERKVPNKIKYNYFVKKVAGILMKAIPHFSLDIKLKIRGEQVLNDLKNINFDKNKKNFLFFHLIDTHRPFAPLARLKKEKSKIEKINTKAFVDNINLTPAELVYLRELCKGEVHYSDIVIKAILEYLEKKLDLEDSLVIVTSDHGEVLGEDKYFGHTRYKVSSPYQWNIPIFLLGGLAKKIDFPEDASLRDIYHIIKNVLLNKKIEYKRHKVVIGYERYIKSGEIWSNATYFPCSYNILDKNVVFESREKLNEDQVPEEIKEIYFTDKKKIDSILETIEI